eukprot:4487342-Pleurochrysis_carterae.AAC.4
MQLPGAARAIWALQCFLVDQKYNGRNCECIHLSSRYCRVFASMTYNFKSALQFKWSATLPPGLFWFIPSDDT